jgi:hypothetical protein
MFRTYWNQSFGLGLWVTTGVTQIFDMFGARDVKHLKITVLFPFFSFDIVFNLS